MTDILDLEVQRKRDKARQEARKKEIGDIKKLLLIPEFRRVVWRVIGRSGYYDNPMTGNSQTFYNIGAQQVGKWILDEVFEADPNAFAQIQNEAISAAKSKKEEEQDE